MKIGIFGGTFDPIHFGHLQLAKNAQIQFSLDKVIFIPAYQPPHKQELSALTSAQDRYEMVKVAVGQEPFLEVSDCEIQRKGISYTFDTIEGLEKKYPGSEFYLILGKDAFEDVDTWHKASLIKKKVKFLVANRTDHDSHIPEDVIFDWVQMPLCPIAASSIRDAIQHGKPVDAFLLPEVLRYIRSRNLYQDQKSRS